MRQFFLFLFLLVSLCSYTQEYKDTLFKYTPDLTPYEGTWVYEKHDTIFTVKLKNMVWELVLPSGDFIRFNGIIGGYSLVVKGKLIDDYIKDLPIKIQQASELTPKNNIYLYGDGNFYTKEDLEKHMNINGPSVKYVIFYDQRNKQYDEYGDIKRTLCALTWQGESFDSLHWHIMTEDEMFKRYRGELFPIPQLGHSVPIDAILKKADK